MSAWKIIPVIIIAVLLIITGWYFVGRDKDTKDDEDITNGTVKFDIDNYPRVDGSSSAHPLAMVIACHLLDVNYHWEDYWDGSKRVYPDSYEDEKKSAVCRNITEKVVHHGTHDAYENLIKNEADIILVARSPSEDELNLAELYDVQLEVKPVAFDAFVFIMNAANPLNSLTIEQIQKIYTGNITNWNEVGGKNASITAYQRNDNSGSQELMKTFVMKDLEMIDAPELVLMGMMGPYNVLKDDQDGIGYTVYFYKEFMAPEENIKLCAVNGILPDSNTISDKSYPFTTEVYVVIRTDLDKNHKAYELREWMLSEDGQKVVEEAGYVPVT